MRPLLYVLGLLATMLATPAPGHDKLRLVADNWPPFTDAKMPGGGLATSIVTTALARAGYASGYEEVPWARALLGVGEGRYDVLINAWYNDSRANIGQFSSAYLSNRIRLLQRKGEAFSYTRLSDLYAYSIAVVRDYTYSPEFDGDPRLNKVPVRNFSSAVRMLAAGRVSLAVEDEYVARYNLQREPQEVRDRVMLVDPPLGENTLHILVSLKHPEHDRIVERFEQAIAAMKADGSYARLLRQYGF
ncbi:transporter substrate-binding domain-containing protein [Pseudomonas plecoglossicida]|uniref:substrate-binding periplasmic protein n=1 Tax=Pseudomonas TaxID=286 RepID=UPI000761F025|nr:MULTISPECIES: transporter substrate-binding domain-containing protein [Pseudomonas]MCX2689811.1 transporter substrate-binding domain-containing protein [Pseudomonas sp. DCB_BZ]MCX2854915.1 transporter substrate-binding domain-containing protein [Pseudomonas sp. DCB_CB]MDQ7962530.1 transporter substrate-binding domain-containing protein [Pseudomonas plecoglossicida]PNG84552.1 Bacterial extracellular solute-binding protein, family 3 [Pseudomonas putida]WBM46245.1 transporter substrate-binding